MFRYNNIEVAMLNCNDNYKFILQVLNTFVIL